MDKIRARMPSPENDLDACREDVREWLDAHPSEEGVYLCASGKLLSHQQAQCPSMARAFILTATYGFPVWISRYRVERSREKGASS